MNKARFESQPSTTTVLILSLIPTAIEVLSIGIVLPQLWNWFITPLFNVPDISFWHAIGISLVFSFLQSKPSFDTSELTNIKQIEILVRVSITTIIRSIFAIILGGIAAGLIVQS